MTLNHVKEIVGEREAYIKFGDTLDGKIQECESTQYLERPERTCAILAQCVQEISRLPAQVELC